MKTRIAAALVGLALVGVGCNNAPDQGGGGGQGVSGSIQVDGSSTVGPLTDAIAEEYAQSEPDVTVNLNISGTGGGFERFCGAGDIQIANASRAIREEEAERCDGNGIDFIEVRVGTDALTMVSHPETDFVDCLTTEEVRTLWAAPGADSWSDVRDGFPDSEIGIFAPDVDSGTYDFFNETVLAEGLEPIADYNASADDSVIATGVIGTPDSWGYFGFAWFQENEGQLETLAYDAGDGCVEPSIETAQDGTYALSRPLFIYVQKSALGQEHVADFVTFYLEEVDAVIEDVGYIPAPTDVIEDARQKVADAIEGA